MEVSCDLPPLSEICDLLYTVRLAYDSEISFKVADLSVLSEPKLTLTEPNII